MLQAGLFVIWSEEGAKKLFIRCRVLGASDEDEDGVGAIEDESSTGG